MIESVASDNLFGPVVTFTRENIKMTNVTVMVRCTGQTDLYIKVNGTKEFSTEEVL